MIYYLVFSLLTVNWSGLRVAKSLILHSELCISIPLLNNVPISLGHELSWCLGQVHL